MAVGVPVPVVITAIAVLVFIQAIGAHIADQKGDARVYFFISTVIGASISLIIILLGPQVV